MRETNVTHVQAVDVTVLSGSKYFIWIRVVGSVLQAHQIIVFMFSPFFPVLLKRISSRRFIFVSVRSDSSSDIRSNLLSHCFLFYA